MDEYDGRQFVGIDLHRRRSVIVRQSESGEQLSAVRIVNDPVALGLQLEQAGSDPEVVLEATLSPTVRLLVLPALRDCADPRHRQPTDHGADLMKTTDRVPCRRGADD